MEEYIRKRFDESAWVKIYMGRNEAKNIEDIADVISKAYKKKGKVVLMGNGGSASQCEHIAAEFSVQYEMKRPSLEAIALTSNTSEITAASNDLGYDKVFERLVESTVKKKDVVIGLTTSGSSPNVLKGLAAAKRIGATTIAMTGKQGLYTKGIYEAVRQVMEKNAADYIIKVPSTRTSVIQEAHITVGHVLCDLVEKKLFGRKKK